MFDSFAYTIHTSKSFIHFNVLFKHSVSHYAATKSHSEKQKLEMFYLLRNCGIPFHSPFIPEMAVKTTQCVCGGAGTGKGMIW